MVHRKRTHTHMQKIILSRLKIFQYDLKCNTCTHGKLPHREQDHTKFYY